MAEPERDMPQYSKAERWAAAAGHASLLLVGVPITLLPLVPPPWSLLFCPVLPYMIGRSFRRRGKAWGAFQGMQASVVQLGILVLAIATVLTAGIPKLSDVFLLLTVLLALYSLWGALDTWLGDDFRYIGISRLLEHVSHRNMGRPEMRGRWLNPGWIDGDQKKK